MADEVYLGPLGDLQEIEVPDSIDRTPARVQSIFQGATGRRTANLTGAKRSWSLDWSRATPEIRHRLESLYLEPTGLPLRFVDPLGVNLLDPRTASGGAGVGVRDVFSTVGGDVLQTLVTSIATGNPGQRLYTKLANSGVTAQEASAGWFGLCIPALGQMTLSAYVLAPNGGTLKAYNTTTDSESGKTTAAGSVTLGSSSSWQRKSVTFTPTGIGCFPALSVPAGGAITVGPMQVELGSAMTDWVPGVGASVVMNTLSDGTTLFPYSDLSLALLEV